MIWDRIGTGRETLVTIYPVPLLPIMSQLIVGQGTDQLYSDDLTQGFAGGTRVGLTCHADNGYDWEISFFEIDGWNNAQSIPSAAESPRCSRRPAASCKRPTVQGQTKHGLGVCDEALQCRDQLALGSLSPGNDAGRSALGQSLGRPSRNHRALRQDVAVLGYHHQEQSLRIATRRGLENIQLWSVFRFTGWSRPGFSTTSRTRPRSEHLQDPYWESASTDQLAFLGEIGLQCKCQLTQSLLLKIGYEAMCLQGVALAPGQIPET